MAGDKSIVSGNTTMLILKLLEAKPMYGYQIIEELAQKTEDIFKLKTGTLYPILHGLERDGMVDSYEDDVEGARVRRYYRLTGKGKRMLERKQSEWTTYAQAVKRIMEGGATIATA